ERDIDCDGHAIGLVAAHVEAGIGGHLHGALREGDGSPRVALVNRLAIAPDGDAYTHPTDVARLDFEALAARQQSGETVIADSFRSRCGRVVARLRHAGDAELAMEPVDFRTHDHFARYAVH